MIIEAIEPSDLKKTTNVLFPLWARTEAKQTLGIFPAAIKRRFPSCSVTAYVDNQLPVMLFDRSQSDQEVIDESYRQSLPAMGFEDVVFMSDVNTEFKINNFFQTARRFTLNEINFAIPTHKKDSIGDFSYREVFEFVWQTMVCHTGLERLACDSIVAGMATRHFYYTARKFFPLTNIYFIRGKPPRER